MKDDITQSDSFADGMLLATAASYPVVRGAAKIVGGAIDEARRRALIGRGTVLSRSAAEAIPLFRPQLEAIDQTLKRLGIHGPRRNLQIAMVALEDRVHWFSPARIRDFVEANQVEPLVLCKELGDFLVAPIREAIDSIRHDVGSQDAADLQAQLHDVERALIKFAAQKFEADISRPDEPSYLIRSWFAKAARIGLILAGGLGGLLTIVYFSIH